MEDGSRPVRGRGSASALAGRFARTLRERVSEEIPDGNDEVGPATELRAEDARSIVSGVRAAIRIPLTVKFRAGLREDRLNFLDLGRICENEGADGVALHPRTAKQFYKGRADWSRIARLKEAVRIPVVGNGDVETPEDPARMIRETGCDAVMIGRATMKNPWIFRQAADLLAERPYRVASLEERRDVILQHFRLIREAEGDQPKAMMGKLKTFTGWYTHSVPKGTELRRRIQSLPTPPSWPPTRIEAAFRALLRTDQRLKSTTVSDERMILTDLVLELELAWPKAA